MRTTAETLGRFIRRLREAKGLTLREVARRADISPAYLSDIELDRRSFAAPTLLGLAKALGVHRDDIAKKLGEKKIGDLEAKIAEIRKGVV